MILPNVPETEYRKMPGVNATTLKKLASGKTPGQVRYELDHPVTSAAMQFGSAVHQMALERHLEGYAIAEEGMNLATKAGR